MLLILRGLPASGKTTYAKEWVAEDTNRVRVNRDDLREQMFREPTYKHEQESAVTAAEHAMVRALLEAGRDVVVDNCNLRKRYVRQFMEIALAAGAQVIVRDFEVSIERAVIRDADRKDRGERGVGEQVIREMAGKFVRHGYQLPEVPEIDSDVDKFRPYFGTPDRPWTIQVDIDGTVTEGTGHRSPYDYSRVSEDTPRAGVIRFVKYLRDFLDFRVVFLSGRPETCREDTEAWLDEHVGYYDALFMRAEGDKRDDAVTKLELFEDHVRDDYNVIAVFDDRNRVVRAWRRIGLTCLQVADGAF